MKKNAMLKIAAILMVAVLLTTCAISSTFAKYTTSANATQGSARVAAFGVTVSTIDLNGLFSNKYGTDNTSPNVLSAGGLVVAPGTSNTGFDLTSTVSGTPEVSVQVTNDVTFTLTGWTVDGSDYFPVVFTINGATYSVDGTADNKYGTVAELVTAINAAADKTAVYAAGAVLDNKTDHDIAISWAWADEVDNAKDTKLGDATTKATISVDLVTTVTQTVSAGDLNTNA